MPKNGEARNTRIERTPHSYSIFGGEVTLYDELTVSERWCTNCNDYISTKPLGLIGHLICPNCLESFHD